MATTGLEIHEFVPVIDDMTLLQKLYHRKAQYRNSLFPPLITGYATRFLRKRSSPIIR
jgi:hypothetical protein